MIIVRLLSPGPFGWFAPPKFTRVQGADIVMESITLMTGIVSVIAFYEKVIKVKADVAAYLINCFPSA